MIPYLLILESLISLNVTPETEPVAPETVLILIPFCELVTVEEEMTTLDTVLSSRPPTLPMERPWPPEHTPFVNVISCTYKFRWK